MDDLIAQAAAAGAPADVLECAEVREALKDAMVTTGQAGGQTHAQKRLHALGASQEEVPAMPLGAICSFIRDRIQEEDDAASSRLAATTAVERREGMYSDEAMRDDAVQDDFDAWLAAGSARSLAAIVEPVDA